ncbi:MAG: PEGA domain-containing protein, partial [Pseudomonadales bacterium]
MSEQKQRRDIKPTTFEAPAAPTATGGFHWRWQYSVALLAGFLVVGILAFLVSARALVITTNAQNTTISLNGGLNFSIGPDRFLLLKGNYEVGISAQGYHPFATDIEVA